MATETKNPPAERIRVRSVEIAIWRNTSDKGTFFSAGQPKVSYKDRDGNYQTSKSLNGFNLVDLAEASLTANRTLIRLRSEAKKAGDSVADDTADEDAA